MSKSSLAAVEDYYSQKGLTGAELREAVEGDSEFKKLLAERQKLVRSKVRISPEEASKYVLSTDGDYEILGKIHELEKKELTEPDRELIKFMRSQLELNWRANVNSKLDRLIEKYS